MTRLSPRFNSALIRPPNTSALQAYPVAIYSLIRGKLMKCWLSSGPRETRVFLRIRLPALENNSIKFKLHLDFLDVCESGEMKLQS